MKIRRDRIHKIDPKLDLTPMADMVFLLLIFFLLSSPFMMQPGIKINLPKAVSAQAEVREKTIVTVTKEEEVKINDKLVTISELERELIKAFYGRKEKTLVLKGDTDVRHGLIVEILDKAKLAGANKLAIATDLKKSFTPPPAISTYRTVKKSLTLKNKPVPKSPKR